MIDLPETPQSRLEHYLGSMIGQSSAVLPTDIQSRVEAYLLALLGKANTIHDKVEKISDRMYYIRYEYIDYEYGLQSIHNFISGACSAVRNGGYFGRNYDWYYDNKVSVVIAKSPVVGKHASVGISELLIEESDIYSGELSMLYPLLPFTTVDGINDAGVFCCVNVVPELDSEGVTTGTNPGKLTVPMACLVRMILDNADSADNAIDMIQNDWNIVGPGKRSNFTDGHFMVGDSTKTYIVEFLDNDVVVIDDFSNGLKPAMTNFYIDGYDGSRESLRPYSMGIERYDLATGSLYSTASSLSGMKNLLQSLYYTKTYTITDPDKVWYSEFAGEKGPNGYLGKDSPRSEYSEVLEKARIRYSERNRETALTWETVHSSVYDISAKKLYASAEESQSFLEFSIPD